MKVQFIKTKSQINPENQIRKSQTAIYGDYLWFLGL